MDTIQIVQTLRNYLPPPHIQVSSWKSESEGTNNLSVIGGSGSGSTGMGNSTTGGGTAMTGVNVGLGMSAGAGGSGGGNGVSMMGNISTSRIENLSN